MILRDARWEAPILIDFGLAKRPFDQGLTQQDLVMGTPGYIAPETMRGLLTTRGATCSRSASWSATR